LSKPWTAMPAFFLAAGTGLKAGCYGEFAL
jgi:hypothetical protein